MKIPRERLRMSRTKIVAISALIALLGAVSVALVSPPKARADVSAPAWWNGTTCDTARYPGSYALGASYNGVQACGPGPTQGGSDHLVNFYTGAWGEYEWECVELVMRYMYQVYGIAPYNAPGGKDVVANYSGSVLTKVTNNGASVPTPGDILSFAASANHPTYGHTAVVTAVGVDGNGNGTVTYMQQNASANGWGSVAVTGKTLGDGISGWLHNPNGGGPNLGNMGSKAPLQDYAIWRLNTGDSTGYWYVKANNYGTTGGYLVNGFAHGSSGDIPLTCDVNGDGISDMVIYRVVGGVGTFYARSGVSPYPQLALWGATLGMSAQSGDVPVVGDVSGDGYCDFGIWRAGTWYIDSGANGQHTAIWGAVHGSPGDIPLLGDVTGDGIADLCIWRLVNGTDGTWYCLNGANGQHTPIYGAVHGSPGDVPVMGDVDGDGITDFGIVRNISGTLTWYFKSSANGQPTSTWGVQQGSTGDIPLAGNFG